MAKLHVLDGNTAEDYRIVVHGPVPGGTNSVGFAWSAIIVALKRNRSVLTVGNGPGQTTQQEMDGILAGTIIEGEFTFRDTDIPAGQRNAMLDAQATQLLANMQADIQQTCKWYGATRA